MVQTFDLSYQQSYEGVQAGFDHQRGPVIFGLTFGAGRSDVEFDTSPSALDMDSLNLGAYATFRTGGFFANALAKVDWIDIDSNPGAGLAAQFDAASYGVRGVAGYRFDFGQLFAEPTVSLSWVNTDVDDYTAGGASITFEDYTSFRGTAGLRIGGHFDWAANGTFSPFVGLRAIEEFNGDLENTFTLGNTIGLLEDAPGTWGEISAGAVFVVGTLEAFVRGEAEFGGEVEGLMGRAGVRLRF